jgi:porin-like protein
MKMVKSLVLGSAAALVAMGGAQAADLPVKAKAVEYVRICSLYGAGFWYIPGTDTCIKLGGYLRVDTTFNGSVYGQPNWSGDAGQRNRYMDNWASRSRLAVTVDTRTATEYGVVRTFGQFDAQFTTLGGNTFNPQSINLTSPVGGSNLLDTAGSGYVAAEYLFIQFAGFTFGKSSSAYATPWNGYPGNNSSNLLGGMDSVTGVNNIQYTAQFGNGVSGSIGLDDPVVFNRTVVANLNLPITATGALANAYGGVHAPDVVGNIRVDQAWGLFQFSAAAHEVNASYNILNSSLVTPLLGPGGGVFPTAAPAGATGLAGAVPNNLSEISGHPDTKWGGSVMAALQIKNLPTGPGDDIKMDASWAKGDTKNVISTSGSSPSFTMFGGSGNGAYQSVGFGATTDAVYLPVINGGDGSLHLTEAFGFRGAFNHNWDPYWSTSLWGTYSAVRYDGTAKSNICTIYTVNRVTAPSADYSCNPDFNVAQLGVVTRWTPVKNLTFSAEVAWFHLDQKFTGSAILTPTAPKPTARYEFKDQDTGYLNVRVQRNF